MPRRFVLVLLCAFSASFLPACFLIPVCERRSAGYHLWGKLLDSETGEPLSEVAVTLTVESADGPVNPPARVTTGPSGSISAEDMFNPPAPNVIETDHTIECLSADTVLRQLDGSVPITSLDELVDIPPRPIRVLVTVDGCDACETAVDLTEDMLLNCPPERAICYVNLGTISVIAQR